MKAFFVTQVSPGKYRLTYGGTSVEGNLNLLIGQILADAIKEECQDIGKDTAYRFEFCDVLPSKSLARALHELECATRAKEAFYRACLDKAPVSERKELFDNLVTATTTMNLDNLWHVLGITVPDKAA